MADNPKPLLQDHLASEHESHLASEHESHLASEHEDLLTSGHEDRLTPAHEDYLEAIYQLGEQGRMPVRSVDLADRLDVSKASVNKAIANLKKAKLVEQPHYGDITLTGKGCAYADGILERHQVLYHFLIDVLGVKPAIAEEEACSMEHAISDDTLRRWIDHLDSLYGTANEASGNACGEACKEDGESAGEEARSEI